MKMYILVPCDRLSAGQMGVVSGDSERALFVIRN